MRLIGIFSVVVLFSACRSLTYIPSETPEQQDEVRKLSVLQQLDGSFKQINKQFKLLAYGQTTTVKPDSYRKLDSLFNLKYNLGGKYNPQLEEAIQHQQAVISTDTLHVVYQTQVWYEITDDSTFEFIQATITTNKTNKIEHVTANDDFNTDSADVHWAEAYMKETDFVQNRSSISSAEDKFFDFYKAKSAQLKGPEKDTFMVHTFHIMSLAHTAGTLSTELLLQSLAKEEINRLMPGTDSTAYELKSEEVSDTGDNNKSTFDYYQVTATFKDGREFLFRYDEYLQLLPGGQ